MEETNKTTVNFFILLAFTDLQQFQVLLFLIILFIYVVCTIGNITIIILIKTDPRLNSPMYSFISVFAALEYLFVSVTVPNLLSNLIGGTQTIPFIGCFAQFYAVCALGGTECYLLAVMAFDRELAIHFPLRYSAIMRQALCIELVVLPCFACIIIALITTISTSRLGFCSLNKLNHFICDLGPLQNVSCFVPFHNKVIVIFTAVSEIVIPFIFTLTFNIHIVSTIINIKSKDGKKKAFSTCSSHLIVATLFYSTAIAVYTTPKGSSYEKYLALMYTVVTPLFNPFIYALRNKDVIAAFRKAKNSTLWKMNLS
ncbi:hypothetical protein GDO86_016460 [Hymenochirus boettgeri]|uniref:G-protein coupled receptors family 1 profile domain-containing protein n=1 Tax=Hymenochirus boettgeri TaxID=247094 RepID=A0A8T2K2H5_9PIPI|nr:hypothetical protein GDO86_016460 [Hymenochirus boettgeri]